MKSSKMILTLSMLIIAICSFARKPPVSVQKAFEQKFPKSINVTWTKATAETWEAFFTVNGVTSSADFTVEGTWIGTEEAILISELPIEVQTALTHINPDWNVVEVNKIQTATNGILYSIDISKGVFKKVAAFKEDGIPVI